MDPALLDTDILSEVIKLRDPTLHQRALASTQRASEHYPVLLG
jgi:hypothetical protein